MKISTVRALSEWDALLTETQQRQRERFADIFANIEAEERLQAEQEVTEEEE
jgi:lysyl-tRNA synthetase class II